MLCLNDTIYPHSFDVYYAISEQGEYGQIEMQWVFDRTISAVLQSTGYGAYRIENQLGQFYRPEAGFILHCQEDPLLRSNGQYYSLDQITISNVRTKNGQSIFIEGAGQQRDNDSIFIIDNSKPVFDPFGNIEAYRIVIVRAQDQQAVGT